MLCTFVASLAFSLIGHQARGAAPQIRSAPATESESSLLIPLHFEKVMSRDSHGFLPLYEYGGNGQIVYSQVKRAIVAPDLAENSKVAYGFLYFTGQPKAALGDAVLFLVENYDGPDPRYFVDLNNNLDLTDDPVCVEREKKGGGFLVSLRGKDHPQRRFTVRIGPLASLPAYEKNPEALEGIQTMFQGILKREGGVATGVQHWLFDQTLNILSANVEGAGLKFQIGVLDLNCNGVYSDAGEDVILIGEYGGKYLSDKLSKGATEIGKEETLIRIDSQTFEVVEVDLVGKFIRIKPTNKTYRRLSKGADLPEFELTMLDGEKVALDQFVEPGKFLLIDFWGHWCAGCIQSLPLLKTMETAYSDRMVLLSLHNGDHNQARKIVREHDLSWCQAEASPKMIETFLVRSWPSYTLVDPGGKIRGVDLGIAEIAAILEAERGKKNAE